MPRNSISLNQQSKAENTHKSVIWFYLLFAALIFLLPFIWMVRIALAEPDRVDLGLKLLINWTGIRPSNFVDAWHSQPFNRYFMNTASVTLLGVVAEVISSALVAYGFARLTFRGRNSLFILMLSTMMLPAQVTMIPIFMLFRYLGWIDTFKPLIVPASFGAPFSIFLLRQFIMTLPRDLDEAAELDGCSLLGTWWRILLPLMKPALLTVIIFSFIGRWNDLLGPLLYLNSDEKFTLSLGLMAFRGMYSTQWNLLMAASIFVMLPCLVLFFIAQRYFIQGMLIGGLKE
jgi:multiple sugar transport system permease protein